MGLISEYISKKLSGVDLEQELLRLIKEYNKVRNTSLLVYAGAISKQIPAVSLIMDDYYTIFDLLRTIKTESLDFYLETPGGSGETAEEIARYLHDKFINVNFVISGEAKSAGTLMALSGNDILMTESGGLGPIDAQIKIGRSTQSGYDYMDWVRKTRNNAAKNRQLNPFDATMIAQISPGELNGVYNSLNFAEDLVVEWLPKYKFRNWNITETRKKMVTNLMKQRKAKKIVKSLIDHNKWRSHGRSIKICDLEKIGLKITKIDTDSRLSDIVYRIQTVIKLLFSTTNTFKIFATESEKIFANALPVNNQPVNLPVQAEVARLNITCNKCGKIHKIYARFVNNSNIDKDLQLEGFIKFPSDNKIICSCGFEIDATGLKNDIETQVGKKML